MQKITPHLWFDKEAVEATKFYTIVFNNAEIISTTQIKDTPSGDCDVVEFAIEGYKFTAISAGPYFKINPAISFFLNFDPSKNSGAKNSLDKIWEKLLPGGKVLMPLQEYPFSKWYGWIEDKFGVSWQLILTDPDGDERPFIVPSLLFTKEAYGKAEKAMEFYLSIFKDSKQGLIARYPAGMEGEKEGTIMFSDFQLENQWFAAMDSTNQHDFTFNEAVSFIINCDTQQEVDYYWEKLSEGGDPAAQQCGWLKDKFGVSWQVVPTELNKLLKGEHAQKATQAFLQMKKLDINEIKKAL